MVARGYSGGGSAADARPPRPLPSATANQPSNRRCEACGGALPRRMHRQRNSKGQLVCDTCKASDIDHGRWNTTYAALDEEQREELSRREAEAITSILRVQGEAERKYVRPQDDITCSGCGEKITSGYYLHFADGTTTHSNPQCKRSAAQKQGGRFASLQRTAHDFGDNARLSHCPFCGSGAIIGRGDGGVECNFCHTVFTVQVQPSHPNMPQTVNGEPYDIPDMPGDDPAGVEMSAPQDMALEDPAEVVPEKQEQQQTTQPPPPQPLAEENQQGLQASIEPRFISREGALLRHEQYLAHLALTHTEGADREAVLRRVRARNETR